MVALLIQDSTWHSVEDPRKRKQMQDSFAQRARRRRLAEAKAATKQSRLEPSSLSITSDRASIVPCLSGIGARPAIIARHHDPEIFTHVEVPASVYTALFVNGAILGLRCGYSVPQKSPSVGSEVLDLLQPTALQKLTYHQPWIDRFPFPKMRDNMISLIGILDKEEFLFDLFDIHAFAIKPDGACWDPASWVMSNEFSKKWGFLLY